MTNRRKQNKRLRLYKKNPNCGVCDVLIPLSDIQDTYRINIDHIIAVKLGGSSREENLQLTHRKCNSIKGDKLPDDPTIKDHPKWHKRLIINE